MNLTEQQLIKTLKKCKKGDRKSQEILFKSFYGKMISVCMRYTRDQDTAQELCQTGFIKVFDKLDKYNFNGSFEGWLRRIMVNTAIDHIRKSKKEVSIIDDESRIVDEDWETDFDSQEFNALEVADVVEAVQKLSPAYRSAFNLYVMENYSHKEISEILDISEGTSKSNLAKAKKNLRKLLESKRLYNE